MTPMLRDHDIQMAAVTAIIWEDDDGQQYRRELTSDGIQDIPLDGEP